MMNLAYVTTHDVLNKATWSKDLQGLCAASYYLAKNLIDENTEINHIGSLDKKFAALTRAKWTFYRYVFQKDYYRWAEPLIVKNYAYQIEKQLKKENSNVVLCPENVVPIAYLECKQPLVLWTDATLSSLINFYRHMSNLCGENIQNIYQIEAAALNRCQLIIYTSNWAAQTAIQTYGISADKVKVVPWGANFECNRTYEDIQEIVKSKVSNPCKLLFIGVDWVRKGGNTAFKVAKELNDTGLETELIVVGCQPKINEPLPKFVKIIDFIDKSQPEGLAKIHKLFTETHFLILPTLADCSPHVLAEANSFGVPSLATNVGGIPTIIQNHLNGKTFSLEAHPSEYCNYIVSLMTNYSEYQQLALSSFHQY
ncbi:MAG: glycosyltransferase family 4 protein, partial [Nostocaceae cyanobacterium]|nr:glycosyltransferase family 4 protein [Nostocaceae cyanobacterium]